MNTRGSYSSLSSRDKGPAHLRAEALAETAIEGLQLSHRRLARAAALPGHDATAREVLGNVPRYVPPVSLVLAARRERYIDGLTTFQRGNLDAWGALFADSVFAAAKRAEAFATAVADLKQRWRDQIIARSDAAAWTLIDRLPAHPVLDARTAEQLTGKSFQAASAALETLERGGVLVRRDNRKRGRSWEAPELIALVRELEADL